LMTACGQESKFISFKRINEGGYTCYS